MSTFLGKDFLGKDLYVGDEVVYSNEKISSLCRGTILDGNRSGNIGIVSNVGRGVTINKRPENVVKVVDNRNIIDRVFCRR